MSVELDHLRRDALSRVHDSRLRIVTRWLGRMNFADALALQENWPVRELSRRAASLEDIFAEVTNSEEH